MVGYGMMGGWHSDALRDYDCCLHTLVGRREEMASEFAERHGYRKWTTNYGDALADDEIDLVILANPSEMHAATALAAIEAGKPVLVEIPIALTLADSKRVVDAAEEQGVTLGVVHPMRMREELFALRDRGRSGEEQLRHVEGRFYTRRLENVGGTGYRRSWTDNLLWHHITHVLDFGIWMLNEPIREVHSFMGPLDEKTGTPMEVIIGLETEKDQALVFSGSYYSREFTMEACIITDRSTYRLDVHRGKLTTDGETVDTLPEPQYCWKIARDFVDAVRDGRPPAVPGRSVVPTMKVLHAVQECWDARHGAASIPGRPIGGGESERHSS
jgi:2-hydroxy-4-carboxymuconate semialdehyde hemiacetal dehydrogenase